MKFSPPERICEPTVSENGKNFLICKKKILIFARGKNLTLTGYAYEEGLNEMAIRTQDDYVTMITIPCQKS